MSVIRKKAECLGTGLGRWGNVGLEAGGNFFLMASVCANRKQSHQMQARGGGVKVLRKGDNVLYSHLKSWNSGLAM